MITSPLQEFLPTVPSTSNLRTPSRRILAGTIASFEISHTMRSPSLSYAECAEPHFLEACTLCSKPLGNNSDIYMYRGNTPYCSQECRQEQIENDEARERRWKLSSKKSKENSKKTATAAAVQTGTLVASN